MEGILDGEHLVHVIAWGTSGSADTLIVLDGKMTRVHPSRVSTTEIPERKPRILSRKHY